jgi:hypothetical protein
VLDGETLAAFALMSGTKQGHLLYIIYVLPLFGSSG